MTKEKNLNKLIFIENLVSKEKDYRTLTFSFHVIFK